MTTDLPAQKGKPFPRAGALARDPSVIPRRGLAESNPAAEHDNLNVRKRRRLSPALRLTPYLALLACVLSLLIVVKFPIYFRGDDTQYLEWAHTHPNPFSSFVPSEATMFGMFRPMQNLAWWCLYRLFGLNPLPYQFFITALYGLSLLFFFKLNELLFSRRVALASLLSYAGIFFYLGYIVFWLSDMTFVLEMFFMNLSLYWIMRSLREKGSFLWGIVFYLCAAMSKEPAAVIVPAVVLAATITEWANLSREKRKKSAVVLGLLLLSGLGWMLLTPFIQGRLWSAGSAGGRELGALMSERWSYYASVLLSEAGILIWISSFYLVILGLLPRDAETRARRRLIVLAVSAVLSLILRSHPKTALIVLVLSFLPILAKRLPVSIGVVWFAVPLAGILVSSFMVKTYLTEASFGMAITVGIALHDIFSMAGAPLPRSSPRYKGILVTVTSAILLIGLSVIGSRIGRKIEALRVMSGNSQNLRDMVDYIAANFPKEHVSLIVLNYGDLGISHREDVLPLDDLTKAHAKKTLSSADFRRLLHMAGRTNIDVHGLKWFLTSDEMRGSFVVVMNAKEDAFINSHDLTKTLIYATERSNQSSKLLHIAKPPAAPSA